MQKGYGKSAIRPKIKLIKSSVDILAEYLSWTLLAANLILAVYGYTKLPKTVPTHFNLHGEADGFGDKSSILFLPLVAFILTAGITWLNHYPEVFNYPVKITLENAAEQYQKAARLLRWLKVMLNLVFLLITFAIFRSAQQGSGQMQSLVIVSSLVLPAIPLIVYFLNHLKHKDN